MLDEKMQIALNEQIVKEFYSAYLYLQMAAYFEEQTLPGFANWMRIQAQEESAHAMIFFNYVCEVGGAVKLGAIDKPPTAFKSPLDVFDHVLKHEQQVTASINNLMGLAEVDRDYATRNRLEWFIAEQVEEEASASAILGKLRRIDDNSNAVFMLDRELAARVFAPPSPLVGGE